MNLNIGNTLLKVNKYSVTKASEKMSDELNSKLEVLSLLAVNWRMGASRLLEDQQVLEINTTFNKENLIISKVIKDSQSIITEISTLDHIVSVSQISEDEFIYNDYTETGSIGIRLKFSDFYPDLQLPISLKVFDERSNTPESKYMRQQADRLCYHLDDRTGKSSQLMKLRTMMAPEIETEVSENAKGNRQVKQYMGKIFMPEFYNNQIPKGLAFQDEILGIDDSEESSEEIEEEKLNVQSVNEEENKIQLPVTYPPIPSGGISGDLFGIHDKTPFGRLPK